jgi:hypothetical protein
MSFSFLSCSLAGGMPLTFVSTEVNGHDHTVDIPLKDFQNTPDGKIYTTSKGPDGHTHQIKLSKSDFINARGNIDTKIQTTPSSSGKDQHIHIFNLKNQGM